MEVLYQLSYVGAKPESYRDRRRRRYGRALAMSLSRRLAAIGVVVPFFALAAATFDASEKAALLLTLAGD
jgi:hypothetical protein